MLRKLVFFGLAVLAIHACRSHAMHINVRYDRLSGLAADDRVLFEGNVAGRVATIHFDQQNGYTVRLSVEKGFSNALTEYSDFYVVDDPLYVGHKAVEIRLHQRGGKPLTDEASVTGVAQAQDLAEQLQRDLQAGFDFFKKQIDRFGRDIQKVPESEAYQRLKRSLNELGDEISQAEKETRQKLKEQWLPQIERELNALKERLRRQGREKEVQPLENQVDRIRHI